MSKKKRKRRERNRRQFEEVSGDDVRIMLISDDNPIRVFSVSWAKSYNSIVYLGVEEAANLLENFPQSALPRFTPMDKCYQLDGIEDDFHMSLAADNRMMEIIELLLYVAQAGEMSKETADHYYMNLMMFFRWVRSELADFLLEELRRIIDLPKEPYIDPFLTPTEEEGAGPPASEGQIKTEK